MQRGEVCRLEEARAGILPSGPPEAPALLHHLPASRGACVPGLLGPSSVFKAGSTAR